MKCLSPLVCLVLFFSVVACGDVKSSEEIAKMSPTEIAQFTCEAYRDIKLERLQDLFPEKSYQRLLRKQKKSPEKFQQFVDEANCEILSQKIVFYKSLEATQVSFRNFQSIKVFKVEGDYRVAL